MRKPTVTFTVLLILLALLAGCSPGKETASVTPAPPVGNVGSIEVAKAKSAGTVSVGSEGTTAKLDVPDSPLDGLEINVPAGAYEKSTKLEVSYAPVEKHSFGDAFNPVSPLITIDNGDVLAEEPVELTIPVEIAEDEFAMGFYYDDERGTLEGLPLVARDAGSITVATRHFSSVIVSAVNTALLFADIDSGFRPGVDDWQFTNRGSYLQPGGHCSGQTTTALWYYVTKPDGPGETLYNRYDNNGWEPATPHFWYDDSLGYRFASVVQLEDDYDSKLLRLTNLISIVHQDTWSLFAYSILVTGEPQFVGINSSAGGGHAMVVYRVNRGALYVADPNYPGRTDRVIEFENGRFKPYNSGANAEAIERGEGKSYDKIFYVAKTAWVDWDRVAELWTDFKTLTIGEGVFPAYRVDRLDDLGNYTPLTDGYRTSEGTLKLSLYSPLGAKSRFEVFRDGQPLSPVPVNGAPASGFKLKEGNNQLGIYISGQIPDAGYKYIDFKYFNVTYTPKTETPTATTTTVTPPPDAKTWKLVDTILPNLTDMPVTFKNSLGTHEMTLTVEANEIICEVRTPVSGGEDKGLSTLVLKITPPPGTVVLGEQGEVSAEWEFTYFGQPSFTSSFVELRQGDFYGASEPIRLYQNPTGSITFKFKPSGDGFEVTARLSVYGDQARIRWVYRLQ